MIYDRGSTNGVWVNGERVQSRPLNPGDRITIGIYELETVREEPPPGVEKTVLMEAAPADRTDPEIPVERTGTEGEKTLVEEGTARDIPVPPEPDATVFAGEGPAPLPAARLICLEGPEAGKEYVLTETTVTLGRAGDNTIPINDESVSRYHAEIVRDEEGTYTLRDKGSRNGTLVAGSRVDSLVLQGGEEILLGTTRFRFVAPGEVFARPQPEAAAAGPGDASKKKPPAPGSRKRLLLLAGGGGGVLLLLLLMLLLVPGEPPRQPPPPEEKPVAPTQAASRPSPPEDRQQKVRNLYQQGIQAAKARNWDEAIRIFDQALALDPAFPLAAEAKAQAERERQVHGKMTQARLLLNEGKYEEASALVQSLPGDTVYSEEIVLLRQRIREGTVKAALAKAEVLMKQRKFAQAREALQAVENLDPGNPEAGRLRAEIAKAEARHARAVRRQPVRAGSTRWMRAYLKGYLSEAAERLRRAGDTRRARQVEQVRLSYEEGLRLYREGKLAQAYSEWDRTLHLDRKLARGKRSFVAREIGRIMAREYVGRGQSAYDQEDYESASKYWRKALAVDPGNPEAKAGLAKLKRMAQKLYQEGYILEPVNLPAAMAKWRQVLNIVPPSDPYYRKASAKLKKYEGQVP